MADAPRRSWSREQVQEILRRAGEQASVASDDGIRHEELLAAAREAGLDPDAVEAAATELAAGETTRQAIARLTTADVARRRRQLRTSALTWGVISTLAGLSYLLLGAGTGVVWPFAVPVLLWGLWVGIRGVRALTPPEPEAMERRLGKERRAAERERASARRREAAEAWAKKLQAEIADRRSRSDVRKQKALELEDAIEDGVRAVLASLARAVTDVASPPRTARTEGEFARYVDRKKGAGAPPAPTVRVEPDDARARMRVEPESEATENARELEHGERARTSTPQRRRAD